MPTIDFNQLSALPMLDPVLHEPADLAARNGSGNAFGDYLKQVNFPSSLPAANYEPINTRNADRSCPPKSEDSPSSNSVHEAARQNNTSHEQEPSREMSPRDEENASLAEQPSSSVSAEEQKAQNDSKIINRDDSKDTHEVQRSGKDAAKDKKKTKEELPEKPTTKNVLELGKDAPHAVLAQDIQADQQPRKNSENSEDASFEDTPILETELLKNNSEIVSQLNEPAAKNVKTVQVNVRTGSSLSIKEVQSSQERLDTAENQTAGTNSGELINVVGDKEKTKSKQVRETTAEPKTVHRKQKLASDNQIEKSSANASESASTPTGRETADLAKGASGSSQTVASIPQSVMEVLKIVEKQAKTEDSAHAIAGIQANSSPSSATATENREAGTASTNTGPDLASQRVRSQFVGRVERAFAAMGERDGSVRLKLSPPELGVLKLEISIHKGVMKARVEAETPDAKSFIVGKFAGLARTSSPAKYPHSAVRCGFDGSLAGRNAATNLRPDRFRLAAKQPSSAACEPCRKMPLSVPLPSQAWHNGQAWAEA